MLVTPVFRRLESSLWIRHALAALLITAALGATHGSRIAANWSKHHWEDKRFFGYVQDHVESLPDCFSKRSYWKELYRPLATNVYYYLSMKLHGNRIEAHHAFVLGVGFANALLLYVLSTALLPGAFAVLPPIIFASRTATAENLAHTCELQTTLATFFCLWFLVLLIFGRRRNSRPMELASLLPLGLGLLCKESAIMVVPIAFLYGASFEPREKLLRYAPAVALGLAWIALYVFVFRTISEPPPRSKVFLFSSGSGVIANNYAAYFLDFFNALLSQKPNLPAPSRIERFHGPFATGLIFAGSLFAVLEVFVSLWTAKGPSRPILSLFAFAALGFLLALLPYSLLEGRNYVRYGYFGHVFLSLGAGGLVLVAHRTAVGLVTWLRIFRKLEICALQDESTSQLTGVVIRRRSVQAKAPIADVSPP
jgi:hypothetical protein